MAPTDFSLPLSRGRRRVPAPALAEFWTPSQCLVLAENTCTVCAGLGRTFGDRQCSCGLDQRLHCRLCQGTGLLHPALGPCGCVLRAVFRICWRSWREQMENQDALRTSSAFTKLGPGSGCRTRLSWSRPSEEYLADFQSIARRALSSAEQRLFRMHVLEGAEWPQCAPRLGLSRGNFYHSVYRIQEKLGRAFMETQPYGIFPPAAYFAVIKGTVDAGGSRSQKTEVRSQNTEGHRGVPAILRPPVGGELAFPAVGRTSAGPAIVTEPPAREVALAAGSQLTRRWAA